MAIFPLAPDQTIAQMWSNGVRGGRGGRTIANLRRVYYLAPHPDAYKISRQHISRPVQDTQPYSNKPNRYNQEKHKKLPVNNQIRKLLT